MSSRDGSHRDNFGESLKTLSAVGIHCRGFLSKLQIFKSVWPRLYISWGRGVVFVYLFLYHKIPSYDTKMNLKVVFDTTAFVKFKISNNFSTIH